MSDALRDPQPVADHDREKDRRRGLISLAAACAAHGVLFVAFALGVGGTLAAPPPAVTIQFQDAAGAGSEPVAGSGGPGAAAAVPGSGGSASSASTAVPAPAGAGPGSGFVVPTPRAPAAGSSALPSGPSFRESGGRTGVEQGIPSVPSPQPGPEVAPIQQGRGSGSATASGSGPASVQRSGTGELVGGSSAAGGSLDLGKLDKALAGGSAGRGGAGGASGSGGTGATGGGGSGGGSGSRSGAGSGTAAAGGTSYPVQWGSPSGEGRRMVVVATPKLPAWVSQQGLTLAVTVKFTVLANGIVEGAAIEHSSGYADVDAAVLDAIRMCLFNSVENAPPMNGVIPYRTDWKK